MIPTIPKALEKPILYGVLIGGGLLAISLYRKGVAGTTSDIAGGIVKGVAGAVYGVGAGIVTATGDIITDGYSALPNAIKPSSADNFINQGVNKIVQGLTGEKDQSLGSWIYDITH